MRSVKLMKMELEYSFISNESSKMSKSWKPNTRIWSPLPLLNPFPRLLCVNTGILYLFGFHSKWYCVLQDILVILDAEIQVD